MPACKQGRAPLPIRTAALAAGVEHLEALYEHGRAGAGARL